MTNNAEATASIDDWHDATPIPSDARDTERREREARERLADGARTGRLLKAPNEQWGAAEPANLIGRVLLATTHGKGSHPAEVDPADICAALALVAPARRDMDRLETQIIMIARNQNLPWRVIAEALGLQSPQAAAQRWQRLTGTTALSSSVVMRQRVTSALLDAGITAAETRVFLGHDPVVILQLSVTGSPAGRRHAAAKVIAALHVAGLGVTTEGGHATGDIEGYLAEGLTAEVVELT